MEEKINVRIDFYEQTITDLVNKFNKSENKYVRNYIRKQICQCDIAITILNELLNDINPLPTTNQ